MIEAFIGGVFFGAFVTLVTLACLHYLDDLDEDDLQR
jgi:hypothetical protein